MVVVSLCATVILGTFVSGEDSGPEPDELELALAEATDHLEVLAAYRPDLMETARRLEVLADSLGGPLRSVRTLRRAVGHWWRRGRDLQRDRPPVGVPSEP